MRLEGSLDAFSLPDIFALLSMTKKTGGLHLRRDSAHGVVWFSAGSLTGGSAAFERQSLLRRVVAMAGVEAETLQDAAALARDESIGVVSALLRLEAVDEARLHEIAGEHIVDTVFSLLRWETGDFEFVVDEANADAVGVERAVDEVVTEARRRIEDWNALGDDVPTPGTVLRLAAKAAGTVSLEPDQWALVVLADGRRNVADIVDLSGRGDYAAVRDLSELIRAGVLSEVGSEDNPVAARLDVLAQIEGLPRQRAAADPELVEADVTGPEQEQPAEPELAAPPVMSIAADTDGPAGESALTSLTGPEPARAEATPIRPTGRDLSRVTPQRPEPFLPGRQPEHPDGGPAVPSTVGALAAATAPAPAPAPASHIERDPSVNKSLLLRLIAGVRGL